MLDVTVTTGTTEGIRDLHLASRLAGDEFAIHIRVCRACKAGLVCFTRRRLAMVADAADDRLDAALEALP